MADHYIYELPDKKCLCQGDILERTPALVDLLGRVHPHYAHHPSYRYFVIITQTCDLVCRNEELPSSPYITIAAARPVEEAIQREAKRYQDWWQLPSGLLDSNDFDQVVLFTESLFNNNVPNYFYLHEDLSLGISGQHCAFLALSITLKVENYKVCQSAKIAQIKEIFRAKLGWLIGNMYSRVGTPDWDDYYGTNNSRKKASQLVKENFVSIDKERKDKAIKELTDQKGLDSYSPQEILQQIKNTRILSKFKRFSDRMNELFIENIKLIDPICSWLIQDINKNEDFLEKLAYALQGHNANADANTYNAIIKIVNEFLSHHLSEHTYPGRERLARRIIETIKQDSIIKDILA